LNIINRFINSYIVKIMTVETVIITDLISSPLAETNLEAAAEILRSGN